MQPPEVVVITGASAGVGRAAARAFGKRGAKVGLIARGKDGLEGAKREIEELGGEAIVLPLDVADENALEQAADEVERTFGPIDIWVNNAMLSVFSPRSRPKRSCGPRTADGAKSTSAGPHRKRSSATISRRDTAITTSPGTATTRR